jgi:chaperonin cofactor prefoldin
MTKMDGSLLEGIFTNGEFNYPTFSESIQELRDIIKKNTQLFYDNNRAKILLDNLLEKEEEFENKIYRLNRIIKDKQRIIKDKQSEINNIKEPNYYDKYERCHAVY